MKRIYPAKFEKAAESGYTVTFPDLAGCITEGDTIEDAYYRRNRNIEDRLNINIKHFVTNSR